MPNQPETNIFINPWLAALFGFIVGVLAASAWFIEGKLTETREAGTAASEQSSTTAPKIATATNGIVSIADQAAGSSVSVDSVNVSDASVWVAVQEVKDKELGNVLGAAYAGGPAEHLSVPLLRQTVPGTTYAIVLYRDNGDRSFDLATDSVYVDFGTGQRVVALFKTIL